MKIALIAGEPSGDKLGAALMRGFRELHDNLTFVGVAGPAMQAEGMGSLFDMSELSVMGIAEILPKYRHFLKRIEETAEFIAAENPDVLVTIDSPEFCHRVARKLRARAPQIRIVHYVAPSVCTDHNRSEMLIIINIISTLWVPINTDRRIFIAISDCAVRR